MHDLVIRGGTVVDGSGAPARAADIAIDGDRIVEAIHRVGHGVFEYNPDHVELGGDFARFVTTTWERMFPFEGASFDEPGCDGGMPTVMLSYWARDRTQGSGPMPLEHHQTRQTAELYSLLDRGLLAPRMRADINVIDHATLGAQAPEIVHDLPSGARRLLPGPRS